MDEASHTYLVPVRSVRGGDAVAVRTGRLPRGQRVAIAFTGPERLTEAMGASQQCVRLSESTLRAMLAPLGVDGIQIDPVLVASDPAPARGTNPAYTATELAYVGSGAGRG